jgi:hypothetical protein
MSDLNPDREPRRSPVRRAFLGVLRPVLVRSAFWSWALLSLTLAASLMVAHTYAMPRPATDNADLQRSVAASRGPGEQARWLVLHFLYSECRCSQQVLTHLFERRALPDTTERLVLIGAEPEYESAARDAGFVVEVIEPAQLLSRYGLSAAPLLVVADPTDRVRYVGGYSERKQGPELRDLAVITALRSGHESAELPTFGCAVSRSLQTLLDPLGLRTTQANGGN